MGCGGFAGASTVSRYAAPPVIRPCAPQRNSRDHSCVESQRGGNIGKDVTNSAPKFHRDARSAAKLIETSNNEIGVSAHSRLAGSCQQLRWGRSANGGILAVEPAHTVDISAASGIANVLPDAYIDSS